MQRLLPSALAVTVAALNSDALAAQDGPPAFVPSAEPLASLRIEDVPGLRARWPETALGRLTAEPECAEALGAALDRLRSELQRRDALRDAAAALQLELEPWQVANLFTEIDMLELVRHPLTELRRAELTSVLAGDAEPRAGVMAAILTIACEPRFEGRWTQAFEARAQAVAKWPWLTAVPDAKVAGNPAHVFRPAGDPPEDADFVPIALGTWMLHLPGSFTFGTGEPLSGGAIGVRPAASSPQVALRLDVEQWLELMSRFGAGMPPELHAIGIDSVRRFDWRVSFAGERVLDELELSLSGPPTGLIAALTTGAAPLPAQALPDGALAQLRVSVDLPLLLDALPIVTDGTLAVPDTLKKDLLAALDGGIALGVAAPAPGGVIPRLYLTLGVRDDAALTRALDAVLGDRKKQVRYGDADCQLLEIPGAPQGLQPAFCRLGGRLHVAESGLSMRAFLKAQEDGAVAMHVGDAPLPDGPGEPVPGFDLRCDEAALYRAFRDIWLPLYATFASAAGGMGGAPALIAAADMPDADVVAPHCGTSRGVLRKDGDRYLVQCLGALGGPELAALAMTFGPMISSTRYDYATEQLARQIGLKKLESAWAALSNFKQREQRWPKDLAELFAAEKLPADALLMPADDLTEPVALADGRTVRASFRYFAEPVLVSDVDAGTGMLLIELRPRPYERLMLSASGQFPEVYGEDSQRPIDRFGK